MENNRIRTSIIKFKNYKRQHTRHDTTELTLFTHTERSKGLFTYNLATQMLENRLN